MPWPSGQPLPPGHLGAGADRRGGVAGRAHPLAVVKRRLGGQISSRALQGDGALSGIGAATGFLALAGLVLYDALGWWWADRVAALVIAAIAAAQAWRTAPRGTVIAGASGAVSPPVTAPQPAPSSCW